MKLWILSRTDRVDYDEYDAFVVLAKDEASARKLAAEEDPNPTYCDRGYDWADSKHVKCEQISLRTAKAQVLLGSYNAG